MLLVLQPLQRRRVEGILAGPKGGKPCAGCLDHEGAKVARRSRSTKLTKVPAAARVFAPFALRGLRPASRLRDPNIPPPASPRRRDSRRLTEPRVGGGRWEREERLEHETSKSTKDTKKRVATKIFAPSRPSRLRDPTAPSRPSCFVPFAPLRASVIQTSPLQRRRGEGIRAGLRSRVAFEHRKTSRAFTHASRGGQRAAGETSTTGLNSYVINGHPACGLGAGVGDLEVKTHGLPLQPRQINRRCPPLGAAGDWFGY